MLLALCPGDAGADLYRQAEGSVVLLPDVMPDEMGVGTIRGRMSHHQQSLAADLRKNHEGKNSVFSTYKGTVLVSISGVAIGRLLAQTNVQSQPRCTAGPGADQLEWDQAVQN